MTDTVRNVGLHIEGEVFDAFAGVEIVRSMTDACGSFRLDVRDRQRGPTIADASKAMRLYELGAGRKARLTIDNETVLIGHVDALQTDVQPESVRTTLVGRDLVGDLVDCAAAPDGPLEYLGLDARQIAAKVAAAFGIKVRVIGDAGPVFKRFAFEAEATAMEVIEKVCRARALLPLSDGVGELVLTRGGAEAGPGSIELGVNALSVSAAEDWSKRFQVYKAKGQAEKAGKLDGTAQSLDETPAAIAKSERAGTAIAGSAVDKTVNRYRPTVISTRTESNGVSAIEQATWAMRVGRGQSLKVTTKVRGWRGADGGLWKPNQLVRFKDRFLGLDTDLLVEGVTLTYDQNGSIATLQLVGPEAYDLIPEEGKRRKKKGDKSSGPLDGKAEALK